MKNQIARKLDQAAAMLSELEDIARRAADSARAGDMAGVFRATGELVAHTKTQKWTALVSSAATMAELMNERGRSPSESTFW